MSTESKTKKRVSKRVKLLSMAVEMLEQKGFKNIRVDLDEYERPAQLSKKGSEEKIAPDLTARVEGGSKFYFEIVTKEKKKGDEQDVVSKWKLLSTLADMRNGTFYLMVPRGTMRYTNQLIKDYDIQAEVLKMAASA